MLTYLEVSLHPEKLPPEFASAIRSAHVERADIAPGMRIGCTVIGPGVGLTTEVHISRQSWQTGAMRHQIEQSDFVSIGLDHRVRRQ